MSTFDKIMELAESEHDIALTALHEALCYLDDENRKRVLDYLESEEDEGVDL